MVVEQVSGLPWAEYLQTNIFDPLGMSSSSVDTEDAKMATGTAYECQTGRAS